MRLMTYLLGLALAMLVGSSSQPDSVPDRKREHSGAICSRRPDRRDHAHPSRTTFRTVG
jgi:hypothetical protein